MNVSTNLEMIANEVLDVKIKNPTSWTYNKQYFATIHELTKTDEERQLYKEYLEDCIICFSKHDKFLEKKFTEVTPLKHYIGTSKLMNGAILGILGFFPGAYVGAELGDHIFSGFLVGITMGAILGVIKGKKSGKNQYKKEFLKQIEPLKEDYTKKLDL